MQVKYAEGESTARMYHTHSIFIHFTSLIKISANKLFVGMLTKSTTEQDLSNIFVPFGEVEEVAILRGPNNVGKGLVIAVFFLSPPLLLYSLFLFISFYFFFLFVCFLFEGTKVL